MPEEGKDGNIFVAGNVFALYADGGVFGKYGDAALTLDIVGIHDSVLHGLIGAEYAALA